MSCRLRVAEIVVVFKRRNLVLRAVIWSKSVPMFSSFSSVEFRFTAPRSITADP
jgi:hypothetical protein